MCVEVMTTDGKQIRRFADARYVCAIAAPWRFAVTGIRQRIGAWRYPAINNNRRSSKSFVKSAASCAGQRNFAVVGVSA